MRINIRFLIRSKKEGNCMKKMKKLLAGIISSNIIITALCGSINSVIWAEESDSGVSPDEKISSELSELINASPEEKQLVYVWYEDVNLAKVETMIEDEIGFGIDSLEVEYSEPSAELLNELSDAAKGEPADYLDVLMEKYLEMTENARNEENNRTELYLSMKREIIGNEITKKADSIINSAEILEENIEFKSRFTPLIICSLSSDQIKTVSENSMVKSIRPCEELEFDICSIDTNKMNKARESLSINSINNQLNLTGDGVKIGIYGVCSVSQYYADDYDVDMSKVVQIGSVVDLSNNPNSTDHETYCAGIAAGNSGIAPDAMIYSVAAHRNEGQTDDPLDCIETMIDKGVSVINISWGVVHNSDIYCDLSKYFDTLINDTGISIVCSTGNSYDENVLCPASAYNTIGVNGYSYYNPVTGNNENVLNDYSYIHGNGCFKPDVVAPSLNNGTSTATPFVTGIIALLYQYKPNLKTHPEAVKAILMASCHKKCNKLYINSGITPLNETMENGLTDKQGAGIPNFYNMISIVAQHSYNYGILDQSNNYSRQVNFVQPKYGASNINVSMNYLQTNISVGNTSTRDDYDISLNNSSFFSSKVSNKSNSSTEMIYTNLGSDDDYQLQIYHYPDTLSIPMEQVRYGFAWSTDNSKFYPTRNEEGIYFIKNVKSKKYLTIDNNKNISQQDFIGNSTQYWIIKDDIYDRDSIVSADGNEKSLEMGNIISGNYHKVIPSQNYTVMYLYNNRDGSYGFERFNGTTGYRLGIYNNAISNGSEAAWYSLSHTNSSQQWYLEPVNFARGDVNMDGEITLSDSSYIMNMYSDISTGNNHFSNIQIFLADYNGDGKVDASDASLIKTIVED